VSKSTVKIVSGAQHFAARRQNSVRITGRTSSRTGATCWNITGAGMVTFVSAPAARFFEPDVMPCRYAHNVRKKVALGHMATRRTGPFWTTSSPTS
jgi:hypothetical protein